MTDIDLTKRTAGPPPEEPPKPRTPLHLVTGPPDRPALDTTVPILPEWLRKRATFTSTVRMWRTRNGYRLRRWSWNGPLIAVLLVLYAPRGLARVTALLARYLYDYDSASVRHTHAAAAETAEYVKAQNVRKANLRARWMVAGTAGLILVGPLLAWSFPSVLSGLVGMAAFVWIVKLIPGRGLGEIGVGAVVGLAVWWFGPAGLAYLPRPPAWTLWLALVAGVLALGWVGRPRGKRLVKSTILPSSVQRLTAPVVTEALCELGNAKMKEPESIRLLSDPVRCGQGYQMDLELPRGVAAEWVVKRRAQFASGIRRELGCVFLSVGPRHPGHLVVYVSDQPLALQSQEQWPLLKAGKVDLFAPVPMFTDMRGEWVRLTFAYASMIIGALPRMGKTFILRQALLVAGLDPRAKVYALDGKATGDLAPCQLFAHFYSRGTKPDEIERIRAAFRDLRQELVRRADIIDGLTREEAPESKVTSALADRLRSLCPIVVGIDETQSYFEYGDTGNKEHKRIREELTAAVTELVKLGPALGVIVLMGTQNVNSTTIPRPISTNAAIRACLKVSDQIENDQIMGTSKYGQGIDATQFDYEDKGLAYLRADGSRERIVRSVVGLDAVASEGVAARARAYREAANLLSGDAAGEGFEAPFEPDLVADVRDVMDHPARPAMHLTDLRDALAELRPQTWAHLDVDALGAMLRQAGVRVGTVWSKTANKSGKGVKREWLDTPGDDVVDLTERR